MSAQRGHFEPHHFAFSTKFDGNGRRRCGECYQPYDDGDHIEITKLKPYTSYVCPNGGGLGHSSTYTGAYRPELRSLRDGYCTCGAEFVEEDDEQWQLTFEAQTPMSGGEWVPVQTVKSRHAAQQQHVGLLQLIEQGEPIRNVQLVELTADGMTGREHACLVGCTTGACETCPCCGAGWCVFGLDGLPEDADDFADWLEIAAEHNPLAARFAALARGDHGITS